MSYTVVGMANATTISSSRSSSQKKMLSSLQERPMQELLQSLRKSHARYVSTMSKACPQTDALLMDYVNLVKVHSGHSRQSVEQFPI